MFVILKEDIANLGFKDEIVEVKPGYGRNFLIPRGMAVIASESAKKVLAENLRQRAHKLAQIKAEADSLAAKMQEVKLNITAKTSSTGTLFGSINSIQIAELLEEKGFAINRKMVSVPGNIKEIGSYIAKVKLHKDVTVEVPFTVESENMVVASAPVAEAPVAEAPAVEEETAEA